MDWLGKLIEEADGSISFERFMHEALHHPEHGYYSAKIKTVGRHGDFSTTATISAVLGKAVANWAVRERQHTLSSETPWTLIEIGAGDGALADAVLKETGFLQRRNLQYSIVESSPVLEEMQRSRLRKRKNVAWYLTIENALRACGGAALIISNELVDAFPVRVVRWNDDYNRWQELVLEKDYQGGANFMEMWHPLEIGDGMEEKFAVLGSSPFAPKERRELQEAFHQWLETRLVPYWRMGSMLTIDYGSEMPELYERRPRGTVRAYFQQMKFEGDELYQRPGRQDLTADVNFTDLRRWGQEAGFSEKEYQNQRDFILEHIPSLRGDKIHEADVEFLLSAHGAGDAFKVLHWRKE